MFIFRWIALLIWLSSSLTIAISSTLNNNMISMPGCPQKCGDVIIPYPFGFGNSSCFREGFEIICKGTGISRKPYVAINESSELIHISIGQQNQLTVFTRMAAQCYQKITTSIYHWVKPPYLFSSSSNIFTLLGCYTFAFLFGFNDKGNYYVGSCTTTCKNKTDISEGICDGRGCCQISVPRDLTFFDLQFITIYNSSDIYNFSPCSYAFFGDQRWLNFNRDDLWYDFGEKYNQSVPTVMNWAIRDYKTCEEAKKNESSYACVSSNSTCFDVTDSYGYVCNCSQGYSGNPYLRNGCQDINECLDLVKYPCLGYCMNTQGSYECKCKGGRDADKDGRCIPHRIPMVVKLAVGIAVGTTVTVVICSFIILSWLKEMHEKEKNTFFKQNGGLILFEQLRSKQVDTIRIFSKEELEKATDNFNGSAVIGQGGRGMVYRGIIEENRVIAIKKSKVFDEDQKEEFVNEMIILSQINHRNVLKLLGCCLEVDVPMLVYEFVANGSLYDNLHSKNNSISPLNLSMRLRIAAESAEALAYLHSSISRPIVHGDVKSQNILLDDKFTAKVSDFGASQLLPLDEAGFLEFVQGTLGYLDPECMQSHQLTDKSDVYSFGVVLIELITGKKAIYRDDSGRKKNLSSIFIEKMKTNKLEDILDSLIVEEDSMDLILEVANIAKYCLIIIGEERPTMRDVAERLHSLISSPWVHNDSEEFEGLLWYPKMSSATRKGNVTMGLSSTQVSFSLDIKGGR